MRGLFRNACDVLGEDGDLVVLVGSRAPRSVRAIGVELDRPAKWEELALHPGGAAWVEAGRGENGVDGGAGRMPPPVLVIFPGVRLELAAPVWNADAVRPAAPVTEAAVARAAGELARLLRSTPAAKPTVARATPATPAHSVSPLTGGLLPATLEAMDRFARVARSAPASASRSLPTPDAGGWSVTLEGRAEAGILALLEGDAGRAVGLCGLGPGATPSGDDVLAGYLGTLQRLRRWSGGLEEARGERGAARAAPRRSWHAADALSAWGGDERARRAQTTLAAAALLAGAAEGDLPEPALALLVALLDGVDASPALAALLSIGHTSGADLAAGIAVALHAAGASR